MNKKILFLTFSTVAVASPLVAFGLTLNEMVTKVSTVAVDAATPIVVIGWVITGILYLTSAGSPEKTGIAKKALIACVIGTLIIALAIGSSLAINLIKDAFGITS